MTQKDPFDRKLQAGKAREVIENPAYQEAMQGLERKLIDNLKSEALKDEDLIIRSKIALELFGQLEKYLEKTLTDGKFAEYNLREPGKKFPSSVNF